MSTHHKNHHICSIYYSSTYTEFNDLPCELEHSIHYSIIIYVSCKCLLQQEENWSVQFIITIAISILHVFLFLVRIIISTSLNEWKRTYCVRRHNLHMLVERHTTHISCVAFAVFVRAASSMKCNNNILLKRV